MDITIQIFSGSYLGEGVPFRLVEEKLLSVLQKLPVNKVFMGWSGDKSLYLKTAEFLKKQGIEFYLWFSVFSETGTLRKLNQLVDFTGQQISTGNICEEQKEEDFAFCCPNSKYNIEKILDIFENNFSTIPFDGIFLDKIRYPSFANGQSPGNVYSCFCSECLDVYKKENININTLKSCLEDGLLGITEYKGNGKYIFEEQIITEFFKLKSDIIFNSLQRICRYFREKNLRIGTDVFAPFLSPFVGQDLTALSGLSDFIKPMMYRATHAPAGLPFETEALLRLICCKTIYDKKTIFGINSATGLEKKPFDLDFTVNDLKNMTAASACPVYAGIEINRVKDLAEIYPSYIEETMEAYSQTGISGFALSWNILDAPDENIDKAAEIINRLK
jgi:hypothetical protein